MIADSVSIVLALLGFLIAVFIGITFGSGQQAALRRQRELGRRGHLPTAWEIVPGSLRRMTFLLFALVVIQWGCPILFEREGMPWLVTAGVLIGYGWMLFKGRVGSQIPGMQGTKPGVS